MFRDATECGVWRLCRPRTPKAMREDNFISRLHLNPQYLQRNMLRAVDRSYCLIAAQHTLWVDAEGLGLSTTA